MLAILQTRTFGQAHDSQVRQQEAVAGRLVRTAGAAELLAQEVAASAEAQRNHRQILLSASSTKQPSLAYQTGAPTNIGRDHNHSVRSAIALEGQEAAQPVATRQILVA